MRYQLQNYGDQVKIGETMTIFSLFSKLPCSKSFLGENLMELMIFKNSSNIMIWTVIAHAWLGELQITCCNKKDPVHKNPSKSISRLVFRLPAILNQTDVSRRKMGFLAHKAKPLNSPMNQKLHFTSTKYSISQFLHFSKNPQYHSQNEILAKPAFGYSHE